jgi:hypothetical protein
MSSSYSEPTRNSVEFGRRELDTPQNLTTLCGHTASPTSRSPCVVRNLERLNQGTTVGQLVVQNWHEFGNWIRAVRKPWVNAGRVFLEINDPIEWKRS